MIDGSSLNMYSSNGSVWANKRLLTRGYDTQDFIDLTVPGAQANTALLRLNANVGIGTTNPTAKLSVNGNLWATEIQVALTNPWPDYVFEKDYTPMSLANLETFIKANKHLPEIPSAKEIAENGLNLGEMNTTLLKKIEELTLHLIDLKKENDQLKKSVERIDNLEQIIKQLTLKNHKQKLKNQAIYT